METRLSINKMIDCILNMFYKRAEWPRREQQLCLHIVHDIHA